MSSVEPGFYRATKTKGTRSDPVEVPDAYFQVAEGPRYLVVYPNGEVVRGTAAKILLGHDLLPVCETERVEVEETPFADDVEPLDE